MTKRTVSGKTIEEAVSKALVELETTMEDLVYDVTCEPQKGFLGLFGTKPAVIEAYVKPDAVQEAISFLTDLLTEMGLDVNIVSSKKRDSIILTIHSDDDLARVIGKRGQTLNAFEHLVNTVVNGGRSGFIRFELDALNYRKKREEALIELALRMGKKALKERRNIVLAPMDAKERKVIHTAAQSMKGVSTYSDGKGLGRHIVITLQED